MDSVLEVKDLRKEYKEFTLDNISFNIAKGSIMGFIGQNGAGKSTTIKLIMNVINKTSGEIKILGVDNNEEVKKVKNKVGFVYDENYYYEDLTLIDMKRIVSMFYKEWDNNIFNKYLKIFNLNPQKKIKELSKGMKMKYGLALALSHNAELIIMDEPTSGLDPVFRDELLEILSYLRLEKKISIFFSTHITTDIEKIADSITFIDKGKLIFSLPKDEIFRRYALVGGKSELLNADSEKLFLGIKKNILGFEALTNNILKVKELMGNSLEIRKPSLEEIMLYTIREEI